MKTPSFIYLIGLLLSCFFLTSCKDETRRIVWSPNGESATLLAGNSLHLMDSKGNATDLLADGIIAAEWVNDEKLLVIRKETVSWEKAQIILGKEQSEKLVSDAETLLAKAASASPEELEGLVGVHSVLYLLPYLLNERREETLALFKKAGGGETDEIDEQEIEEASLLHFLRSETHSWNGTELGEPIKVDASILVDFLTENGHVSLRMHPDGTHSLLSIEEAYSLGIWLLDLENGKKATRIAGGETALFPDWTPNGKSVVYTRGASDSRFGEIVAQKIFDDSGAVAVERAEVLVYTPFHKSMRTRCLENGNVLFAAPEWNLPSPPADGPISDQLFELDMQRPGVVNRVLSSSALVGLPDSISFFELSPDKMKMLVASTGDSKVFTLSLNGEPKALQEHDLGKLRWMPTWRNTEEICLLVKDESGSLQAAIRNGDETQIISGNWSPAIRKELLSETE